MRDLAGIMRANEEQVRKEFKDAIQTLDWERTERILQANPDLFPQHLTDPYQEHGGEA